MFFGTFSTLNFVIACLKNSTRNAASTFTVKIQRKTAQNIGDGFLLESIDCIPAVGECNGAVSCSS